MSARVAELAKQKDINDLHVSEFFLGYTKEEELACDLNGQKLAAKAGYSPCWHAHAAGNLQISPQRTGRAAFRETSNAIRTYCPSSAFGQDFGAKANTTETSVKLFGRMMPDRY